MLVLILTFGASTATKITSYFSDIIYGNKNALKDVQLEEFQFIIENEYHLKPIIFPETCSDSELEFTSLDPDVFTVNNGIIVGKRQNENVYFGTLLITSKNYPEFKKEVELIFKKNYPTLANVYLYNEYNKRQEDANVYLHKPFSIVTEVSDNGEFVSEKEITYEYDQNLFEEVSKVDNVLTLKPKYYAYQVGTSFTAFSTGINVYVNGTKIATKGVVINPLLHAESFTSAKLSSKNDSILLDQTGYLKSKCFIELYNEDTNIVTPFTITSSNEEIIKVHENNELEFLQLGTASITITLNNGFSKTYNLTVKNKMVEPVIYGDLLEDGTVHILQEFSSSIGVCFKDDAAYRNWTYQVVGDSITTSIDENGSIIFEANKVGESTIIISLDDGVERPITKVVKVVVENNPNSKTSIIKSFGKFLAKVAGHMSFFVLEAFLAYFMMLYYRTNKQKIDILIYFGIGLLLASLTEFIQIFLPGRYPAIKDILIDMSGYIIGLGCSILFFYVLKKIKNKKGIKNE